jgi:HK97 family phage portal protein
MIFDRIASGFSRKTSDISSLTWTELFPEIRSKSGVSVNIDTALRTTTVFACARVLAEGVAQLPKQLFDVDIKTGNKTKNTEHPAYHLLTCEPNEFMTSFEFYETMTMHAVLTGNAFAYLGWSGNKIVEIIPLVPNSVQVVRHTDWSLTYIVSDLEGKITTLDAANVLHLRGPSWNTYGGLDAMQLARDAVGLAIATEETHASLHANGAQPGGVLSVKGKLDKDSRERLKTAWNAFQGGVANRFKTAVLDVDAEWKPLSMSGVDSQHLETRRFQIEEICRALRVYPQMVMHTDKTSTFASAEQFFIAHVQHSLMPWVVRWEQAINRVILKDDDNLVCKFNVTSMMRGDAAQRASFYQAALGGGRPEAAWMTRNEVRELEDFNPIEGGDELPKPAPEKPNAGVTGASQVPQGKMNPYHDGRGRFAHGPGIKATGEADARIQKNTWVNNSPLTSLEEVYAGAGANKDLLDEVGQDVSRETGAEYHAGPIKKIERAMEKVAEGRKPQGVNDIVRATYYVNSPAQADSVVESLAKNFALTDEGYRTTENGYFDRSVNVRFPNGQLGEVLIVPPTMAHAKAKGGHDLYTAIRSLPQGDPMREALSAESRKLYGRVYDGLSDDWKAVIGSAGKSG